jgi:Bacterial SH3 domain
MLKPVMAAACLCGAAVAGAQSPELTGRQINALIAGATVEIDTPLGVKLPFRYGQDGQLSGEARGLDWHLGSASDTGRWWVTADQLCHQWSRWFNAEPMCLRISREGRVFRWRKHDGSSGTASIAVPAPPAVAQASLGLSPPQLKRFFPATAAAAAPPPPSVAAEHGAADPARDAIQPAQQTTKVAVAAVAKPLQPAAQIPVAPNRAPPQKQAEPQPQPKRASQPLFMVANVRQDDVLNVRSGPSSDFGVVGELQPGSRGIAITSACVSKWCPVQHRSTKGWVNSAFLVRQEQPSSHGPSHDEPPDVVRETSQVPRSCLTPAAHALLDRIERKFGAVQLVSTCRPGAIIAGTGRPSRHASGNAIDFKAGGRKAAIVAWLLANHRSGGTMTYARMDHIHVDIGPYFVSLANGPHWSSWYSRRDQPGR